MRHGETVWNALGKISGWHDVDLSPQGEKMAQNVSGVLQGRSYDRVYSSDLIRAVRTAQLAGFEPIPQPELRELNFGDIEGRVWQEMSPAEQQAVLDFDEFCIPGGERISEFEKRIYDFVDQLGPGRFLLFVHGGVLRSLLRPVGADRFLPPTSVIAINWTEKRLLEMIEGPQRCS